MMRALFAAISGLQNHVTYMDVVGNNIANVNTQGYKASRVTFQDMLTQNISGASAPTADRGGTNPQQVGLGMKLGGINVMIALNRAPPTRTLLEKLHNTHES